MKRLGLITFVAALLTGCAAATTARFNPNPVFPIGPISRTTSHQIAKLDEVASRLAGGKTVVNCWSDADWKKRQSWNSAHHQYGSVDEYGVTYVLRRRYSPVTRLGRIQLPPFICEILRQTLARSVDQPLMTAGALSVLAHESAHAAGVSSENRAECRAIRTLPRIASLFGLSKSLGVRLQRIYRGTLYPTDDPRYNKPACPAGLPGIVAPSTTGRPSAVAPLRGIAAAIRRVLPRWRNAGGWHDFQPSSACGFGGARWHALAGLEYTDQLNFGEFVDVRLTTASTRTAIETAGARLNAFQHCAVAEWQQALIQDHSGTTVSLGPIPKAITDLSPRVRAYRVIWRHRRQVAYLDDVLVFNPSTRRLLEVYFAPTAGSFPLATELRATKVALRY